MEKNKKASLYLLSTVALVEKVLSPEPLLLQLFDGKLKLVASGGGWVDLLGGHCCQQAVGTLCLALQGIFSVFLGPVGWKADVNRIVLYTVTVMCRMRFVLVSCQEKLKQSNLDGPALL